MMVKPTKEATITTPTTTPDVTFALLSPANDRSHLAAFDADGKVGSPLCGSVITGAVAMLGIVNARTGSCEPCRVAAADLEAAAVAPTVAEQRQARRQAVPDALRNGVMAPDIRVIIEALDAYALHLAAVELPSWADIARAKNHADRRRARNMRDLIARAL